MKIPNSLRMLSSRGIVAVLLAAGPIALAAGSLSPTAAFAQQNVQERVERMEKEIRALQRRVFEGREERGASPAPGPEIEGFAGPRAADYEVRLTAIESRLQELTGQIEELRYRSEETARRLETFMADAEFRFNALSGNGQPAAAPGAAGASDGAPFAEGPGAETGEIPVPPSGDTAEPLADGVLPVGTAIEQYEYAYSMLAQGKYEAAESAFRAFLDQHGADDLAGNANYWMAQSYYVRSQYEAAAKSFLEGYQAYPKSSKAPDYLLKIGMSLAKIEQKEDACAVFRELETRFPDARVTKERLAEERKVAGC